MLHLSSFNSPLINSETSSEIDFPGNLQILFAGTQIYANVVLMYHKGIICRAYETDFKIVVVMYNMKERGYKPLHWVCAPLKGFRM